MFSRSIDVPNTFTLIWWILEILWSIEPCYSGGCPCDCREHIFEGFRGLSAYFQAKAKPEP